MNSKTKSMQQKLDEAFKTENDLTGVVIFLGILIYASGIIYTASHVLNFTMNTIPEGFLQIMGLVGSIGVILNAAALPLALHEWTFENTHRTTAIIFYIIDLVLIAGFVWADTNITRGSNLELAEEYMKYVSPVTFINSLVTWGLLFILDPKNMVRYQIRKAETMADLVTLKTGAYIRLAQAEAEAERKFQENDIDPATLLRVPDYQREPEAPTRTVPEAVTRTNNHHSPK